MGRESIVVIAVLSALAVLLPAHAQEGAHPDLRQLHERVVYNMVQIRVGRTGGTGWLLAQSGRPVVITNAHVADAIGRGRASVFFYAGSSHPPEEVQGTVMYRSRRIDLAVLRLESDPPTTARPLRFRTDTTVVRGQRVVLGGNPDGGFGQLLPFQTTEGVVTGHVSGRAYDQCGAGRNCVVVDAASLGGSSGGPAFNLDGQLVGMLWGGPLLRGGTVSAVAVPHQGQVIPGVAAGLTVVQNPSLSYLIHTRTIADELRRLEAR